MDASVVVKDDFLPLCTAVFRGSGAFECLWRLADLVQPFNGGFNTQALRKSSESLSVRKAEGISTYAKAGLKIFIMIIKSVNFSCEFLIIFVKFDAVFITGDYKVINSCLKLKVIC